MSSKQGPLAGVAVLELASVWAGPCSAMLLGFLGASVVKVESTAYPDLTRRSGGGLDSSPSFHLANIGKRSVALDIDSTDGAERFLELVAATDIVITNIQPPSLKRKGLDYDSCSAVNPGLIWGQISTSGSVGRESHYKGYAPSFNALSGLSSLTGYEDGPPAEMRSGGDMRVAYDLALACVAALLERRRTGEGLFIDLSCREVLTSRVGDELVAAQLQQRGPRRGNEQAGVAPAGCYQTADEQWLALEIRDDAQWDAFCMNELGAPSPPHLNDAQGRWAAAPEVNARVAQWSKTVAVNEACEHLQSLGIAAARSMSNMELANLDHLWQRRLFFEPLDPDGYGPSRLVGAPWNSPANHWPALAAASERPFVRAPRLGEHSEDVLSEVEGPGRRREELLQSPER